MVGAFVVHVLMAVGGLIGALVCLAFAWRAQAPAWLFFLALAAPLALFGALTLLFRLPAPGLTPVALAAGVLAAAAAVQPRPAGGQGPGVGGQGEAGAGR